MCHFCLLPYRIDHDYLSPASEETLDRIMRERPGLTLHVVVMLGE